MMLRTTAGWSLTFVLVLGGIVACSSKSTDEGTGAGGNGTIVGGSSNTGGTTATGTGGTATATGGTATATGGTAMGACTDTTVTCTDAMTASFCNPDTGKVQSVSCATEFKGDGITSNGCKTD